MMVSLLFFSIVDFTAYVLGAFVCFSAGLLFFESWKLNTIKKTPLLRSIGFFLFSLVYVAYATTVDFSGLAAVTQLVKVIASLLVLVSLMNEPVLHKPGVRAAAFIPLVLPVFTHSLVPLSAACMLLIAVWYLRKATEGLEKQLKPAGFAFLFLAVAEIFRVSFFWSDTANIFWSKLLAPHGLFWNMNILLQIIGLVILGSWLWGYIRFRLRMQLFTTILAATLMIFLVTTTFFTAILLRNVEQDALSHLKTDANVFRYAIDRLQMESLSYARSVARTTGVQDALMAGESRALYQLTSQAFIQSNFSSLVVASVSGVVVMRAEDRENVGDNLSSDPLVGSALSGQQISTLTAVDRPVSPDMYIYSSVPVNAPNGRVVGAVMSGLVIDNAFVDGIKEVTGLDATIFVGDKRTATTLRAPDGTSRFSGSTESNTHIVDSVRQGNTYIGSSMVLGEPFYTAYAPLRKYGGDIIGMLFIGKPQAELLATTRQSVSTTLFASAVLMMIAVGPVYLISRFIEEQLEA